MSITRLISLYAYLMTLLPTSMTQPLCTDRLQLRMATAADAPAVWTFRQLPEVTQWITSGPTTYEAFLEMFADPQRLARTLMIELTEGAAAPKVIGDVMVRIEDGWAQTELLEPAKSSQAELGWTLDPNYSGRGYATEVVRAVIDLCFGPLGLRRVVAGCFAANEPSWRLMERLGMRREEYSRASGLHRSGQWMNGMMYGILAEEWREQRGGA